MCAPLSADGGAAFLAAAVRAAVLAKAPRRTVAAVAAAVASALARPAPAAATRQPVAKAPAGALSAAAVVMADGDGGSSPEDLLAALRSARAAVRRRKKERRRMSRAASAAAAHGPGESTAPVGRGAVATSTGLTLLALTDLEAGFGLSAPTRLAPPLQPPGKRLCAADRKAPGASQVIPDVADRDAADAGLASSRSSLYPPSSALRSPAISERSLERPPSSASLPCPGTRSPSPNASCRSGDGDGRQSHLAPAPSFLGGPRHK